MAGAACVMVDVNQGVQRLKSIMDMVSTKVALCDTAHVALADVLGVKAFVVDLVTTATPRPAAVVEVRPSDAAFVVFTSGSTGAPKGVVIEHTQACTTFRAHAEFCGFTKDTRIFNYAAYSFDVAYCDIFTALTEGCCVCCPSEADRLNDPAKAITNLSANFAHLTPNVADFVLDPKRVPTLKTLALAGEAVPRRLHEKWFSHVNLIILYGPTECAVDCLGMRCGTDDVAHGMIGRPICSKAWIVDPHDFTRVLPVGAIGELVIEGPLVTRGYWGNPEQTKHAFVRPAPETEESGTKYYRNPIRTFDFTELDGREKWTAYKFTKKVYDNWMPRHFERICSAINQIPADISFSVSQSELNYIEQSSSLSQDLSIYSIAQSSARPTSTEVYGDAQSSVDQEPNVTPSTLVTSREFKKPRKETARRGRK